MFLLTVVTFLLKVASIIPGGYVITASTGKVLLVLLEQELRLGRKGYQIPDQDETSEASDAAEVTTPEAMTIVEIDTRIRELFDVHVPASSIYRHLATLKRSGVVTIAGKVRSPGRPQGRHLRLYALAPNGYTTTHTSAKKQMLQLIELLTQS